MKKLKAGIVLPLFASFCLSPLAHAWNWGDAESANNPAIFETDYEYTYSKLPLKASIQTPWSENYWPSKRGSLNFRWNSRKAWGFAYKSPSKEEAKQMTVAQLRELSPTEKYDLAMGHYDYPLRTAVDTEIADKKARSWEGLCNGWASASLYYPEPKPVNFKNPDGIMVPFGASDIKGLLSYFMAVTADEQIEVSQIGLRCDSAPLPGAVGPDECDDVNAGALHVVLTNEIGKRGRGFVADVKRTKEVWNQPIYGYELTEVGSAKTKNAHHAIRLRGKILYGEESKSQWEPMIGTPANKVAELRIDYILELDQNNKVVGGEWISKFSHPDFIWRVNNMKSLKFKAELDGLNQIYQPTASEAKSL